MRLGHAAGKYRTPTSGWIRIWPSYSRHLDAKVGPGNYVVALKRGSWGGSCSGGYATNGADAGVLHVPEGGKTEQKKIEETLAKFSYTAPTVARIVSSDIYFFARNLRQIEN